MAIWNHTMYLKFYISLISLTIFRVTRRVDILKYKKLGQMIYVLISLLRVDDKALAKFFHNGVTITMRILTDVSICVTSKVRSPISDCRNLYFPPRG